jgi:hypothetical protein
MQVENYQNTTTKQSDNTRERLNIKPPQNLSSPDLSWAGCSIIFILKNAGKGATTGNSCDGHLSAACQQNLTVAGLSAAQRLAGTFGEPGAGDYCRGQLGNATFKYIPACYPEAQ